MIVRVSGWGVRCAIGKEAWGRLVMRRLAVTFLRFAIHAPLSLEGGRRMVNLALAAALASASLGPVPSSGQNADPAIFQVQDGDTKVYIFGTFHALDGKADWFNDEVRTAFDSSSELILETVIPEPNAGPLVVAAPPPALPGPHVTTSASFLGTTKMAINAGKSQGLSVNLGADMVLRRAAGHAGKQVEGLETLESQLAMFARMPPAAAPKPGTPVSTAQRAMPALSKAMIDMQDAWKRGEQTIFVRMLDQLRHSSPDMYRTMFTERNSRWADWIAARMQTPGTVFVAVGAGHLAGKDSVLVRLAEMGIESSRLD